MMIDAHAGNAQTARKQTEKSMRESSPRGIAVVDVGYTNTKIALFSAQGELLAERKAASRHVPGPPYLHIDPEPMVDLCRTALPELDALLPIDAIVPTAHGAAMACLDGNGDLALPVMDYTSEPPPEIVAEYRKIMPSFAEALCPLLPLAITHGLQLYWQMRMWPDEFARVRTLLPWIQYVGYRLSGVPVTEISSMACQTHLLDIRARQPSRMARDLGWDRLFPRMAKAWEEIGTLKPEFRGEDFRGAGRVLGGVHDSTANFMRYVCAGLDRFTLVSTGTWSISFDPSTSVDVLDPERDTNTNTDVLGRDVCCSRFFGGKEFEAVAGGARGGGRIAGRRGGTGGARHACRSLLHHDERAGAGFARQGRVKGPAAAGDTEKASLAALYCALMVSEQLDAIASKDDIIVDGPFSQNKVLLSVLAALRPQQTVKASALRDGTTAGAAALALIEDGRLPAIALSLTEVRPAAIPGLDAYQSEWRRMAYAIRCHPKPEFSGAQSWIPAFAGMTAVIVVSLPIPAAAFDCAKAGTAVEKAICQDPAAKRLDDELGATYAALRASLAEPEQKMLAMSQKRWIARREFCGGQEDVTACAKERTAERLALLAGQPLSGPGAQGRLVPQFLVQEGTPAQYDIDIAVVRFAEPRTAGEQTLNRLADEVLAAAKLGPHGETGQAPYWRGKMHSPSSMPRPPSCRCAIPSM
jgi:sugar (pentulose or hexulose) kinase/uncharacterized protein YecT (DUF1311 family)